MKKTKEIQINYLGVLAVLAFLLVIIGILWNPFAFVSYAAGQGKVVVSSAKIRQEADVNSTAVGSAMQGTVVTINEEVTGADGKVWYAVVVNDITGYIRSDLIQKEEGTVTGTEPTVEVTEVQPQSATIVGEEARVRSDASATDSQIITTIQGGVVITITGQAFGADGSLWYRINFMADNGEVNGFIRSDYVDLGGVQLVPADDSSIGEEGNEAPPSEETPSDSQTQKKTYEALLDHTDGAWYLIDRSKEEAERYKISDLFETVEKNHDNYVEALDTIKKQKIAVIVLIILLVFTILAATLLYFKMRDTMDEAYFAAVEKETIKERGTGRSSGSGRKAVQKVGNESESTLPVRTVTAKNQLKPVEQKTQHVVQGKNSVRTKSTGQEQTRITDQVRPIGQAQRTQKLQGNQQSRPAQGQTTRRVIKEEQEGTQIRVAQPKVIQPKTVQPKPRPVSPKKELQNETDQSWKSKNFMTDEDDEFEFEFLNWDGDNH